MQNDRSLTRTSLNRCSLLSKVAGRYAVMTQKRIVKPTNRRKSTGVSHTRNGEIGVGKQAFCQKQPTRCSIFGGRYAVYLFKQAPKLTL